LTVGFLYSAAFRLSVAPPKKLINMAITYWFTFCMVLGKYRCLAEEL
jgi:hypothetical protein